MKRRRSSDSALRVKLHVDSGRLTDAAASAAAVKLRHVVITCTYIAQRLYDSYTCHRNHASQ